MLKRVVLAVAVVVLLVGGVGSAASAAAPAAPVAMSYACALKVGGLMRYVVSASKCSTKLENAITITPGPVKTCVVGGLVFRTSSTCTARGSRLLTLPPASGNVYFCALKVIGTLRSVSAPSSCSKLEFAVVVTPSNRAPNAVADTFTTADGAVVQLDVRGNDSDPDGDSFLITAIGGSPVGVPTITGGGTGISYDSENAWDETPYSLGSFTDTFTYTITDSHGATATGTVTVVTWDETFDFTSACIPLTLSSSSVQAGATVTLSATDVTGGGLITILLDGNPIGQTTVGTTPAGGQPYYTYYSWSTTVTIPANTAPGNHTLKALQIRSTTQPQGCPNQVATIVVNPADISLTYFPPQPPSGGSQGFPASVAVTNAGPSAATVSVFLSAVSAVGINPAFWQQTSGPTGTTLTSVTPIPAGESFNFYLSSASGGYVEVSASSNPDPDSTPNNHVTTEDDYVTIPIDA